MTYKTIVTDDAPRTKKMADEIKQVINEKAKDGWEPVTFSVTNSCKAILVFRVPEDVEKGQSAGAAQKQTPPRKSGTAGTVFRAAVLCRLRRQAQTEGGDHLQLRRRGGNPRTGRTHGRRIYPWTQKNGVTFMVTPFSAQPQDLSLLTTVKP